MKILFLHLSDAHLRDNTDIRLINMDGIVKSLSQIGKFDECAIVFSGDVVNSGDKNAYVNAGRLVGYIAKNISQKYINKKIVETLIVPGNHDNLVKNKNRDNFELESYYEKKEVDLKFDEDLKQLSNFYRFANRNKCFLKDKIIDVRKLKFGEFIIKVNLINSAPFSLLGSGNRDKGMHYIPMLELQKLNIDMNQKYTISVIHHGPEWFSDGSKHKLYNMLHESTDLLFVGHEHFSLNEDKTVNGNHIDISSGLALYGTDTEHGFNALILDTDIHTLIGYKFTYNGKIYKPLKVIDNKKVVFNTSSSFKFTPEFQKELLSDTKEREGETYSKYFVFPSLEPKEINSDLKKYVVNSEDKFKELMTLKMKISIEGGSHTGKSILAKYLANQLSEDYTVLFLTEDSFAPKNIKNIVDIYKEIEDNKECYTIKNLKINGNDILSLGYKNKEVGQMLNKILYEVIKNPKLNNKDQIIEKYTKSN